MPFEFKSLSIEDLVLVKPKLFFDERGVFWESNKNSDFINKGLGVNFVQDNFSISKKGVIRGLHFQRGPFSQGKLVSVVKGSIYDVAVDIRKDSKTFGEYVGINLDSKKREMLYIPEGFAHGFCSKSEETIVFYKNTNEYSSAHECGIIFSDPDIGIDWPIENGRVSEKDLSFPFLRDMVI